VAAAKPYNQDARQEVRQLATEGVKKPAYDGQWNKPEAMGVDGKQGGAQEAAQEVQVY
jgi:hypothetical protein